MKNEIGIDFIKNKNDFKLSVNENSSQNNIYNVIDSSFVSARKSNISRFSNKNPVNYKSLLKFKMKNMTYNKVGLGNFILRDVDSRHQVRDSFV